MVQTLTPLSSTGVVFHLAKGFSLMVEVPLLLTVWWGAYWGFVPKLPVVPTIMEGLLRDFGGVAAAISGVCA